MIKFNLHLDNASTVTDSVISQIQLTQEAQQFSDGRYDLAYDAGWYDKEDHRLVMADTENVDEGGYPVYPIKYFLGCDQSETSLNLEEGVGLDIECNANYFII